VKLFFVLIFFISFSCCCQEYQGLILDSNSQDPIAYASVIFNEGKNAVYTNEKGEFSLANIQVNTILIQGMGYVSSTAEINKNGPTIISLARKELELAEVVILKNGETPRQVMFKVFENIKKNYNQPKTEYKAFYRHYCKEDSSYGRLIEAALTIYDPKGHKGMLAHPKNKVQLRVDQVRRSFDYTKNFEDHDPISIYSTLKYDLTSYPSIHMAVPDDHNYRFLDTTYYDGNWVYIIGYDYKFLRPDIRKPIEFENHGKIYVNTSDYAVLKIEEFQTAKQEDIMQLHTFELNWEVNYTMLNGRYHLTYSKEQGYNKDFFYNNEEVLLSTKDHLFHVEIMVNGINDIKPQSFKGVEPDKKQLKKMSYHPEFWASFPVLKDSPLNQEIIDDLEKQSSLKEQYDKEN
jgi:hypothetical protein